ncbi:MAG: gamma-glutamylcyclotransferase [Sphingomonadales bacterium]|nr:gamma-glutamylcyclotransferase [Sphingomonadales bacterium]
MLFFFYGTLIAGSTNAAARAAHRRLRPMGAATTRGRLHAITDARGWYPALTGGEGLVQGRLYEALPAFGPADLAKLDTFEAFDRSRPETSDYLRQDVTVRDRHGHDRTAQAYLWHRPIPPDSPELPGGDFAAWLAQTGLPAYR